jgi:hypothetical protein
MSLVQIRSLVRVCCRRERMTSLSQYLGSVIGQWLGRLPCCLVQDVLKYGGLVLLRSSHVVSPDEQLGLGLPMVLTLLY